MSVDWLKLKDIGEMGKGEKREAGKLGSWEVKKHLKERNALLFRKKKLLIKFLIVNC